MSFIPKSLMTGGRTGAETQPTTEKKDLEARVIALEAENKKQAAQIADLIKRVSALEAAAQGTQQVPPQPPQTEEEEEEGF